ncbi:MAG: glycosyltransferase family 4 protein [Planctomycetaceae bacterium]|nr:glycosyltransferase family 4 protein [Planctomycetaceae bacterium]
MTKKLIFDIANLAGQNTMTGIPRYICEVLLRLFEADKFEIVTICSLPEEESALRNFRQHFPYVLPFQSKNVEHYVLPDRPAAAQKSLLKKAEDFLTDRLPDNQILKSAEKILRSIKWKLAPPAFFAKRDPSPFYEKLVNEADIYFSPFNALIPELNQKKSIQKILVVHDLIPVVLADMYKDRVFFPENPYDSITPDVIVFADSESTRRDLLRCCPHVLEEQVTTAYLAADERFAPCNDRGKIETVLSKYAIPVNTPYILSVASWDVRKNFDHVINSFAKFVLDQNSNLKCNLALTGNSGWGDKKFKKAYANLPNIVKTKIILTGHVDDADLPLLYAGAECFCYMSIYEGFGLPPLEAMQSGTPVITSNTSSLPEVVGNAAITLDPTDKNELAATLTKITTNKQLKSEMIQKGLEQAKKFTWENCTKIIIERITKK